MHCIRRYVIGGACIAISSPDAPLTAERDGDYLPFVSHECHAGGDADIAVDVRLGDPALPPGAHRAMEAGEAWTAHELGGECFIAPHIAPPASRLEWLLAVHPGRRRATLTCSAALLTGPERLLAAPIRYPLDQILLSLGLAGEGLIMHAAAVQFGGSALVLAGPSGAGKTTIARICAAAGRAVLSDDRVVIRRSPAGWLVYGTPWPGEGRYAENRGLPLAAVIFLVKGGENLVAPLPPSSLARRLTPLASIPWFDPDARGRCLDLLASLAGAVPVHELVFSADAGAERALAAASCAPGE